MSAIDKIIYNLIATHRGVNLPQAGSLNVERRGAAFAGRRALLPPRCRVVYSRNSRPGNCDLVREIARLASIDETRAMQLYESWLHEARATDPRSELTISGVGALRLGFFTLEPGLEALLNPDARERIALSPRGTPRPWLWSLAAAGAAAGVWLAVTRIDFRPQSPASEDFIAEQLKNSARDHARPTAPQPAGTDGRSAGELTGESAGTPAQTPAGEPASEDFIIGQLQRDATQSATPEQTTGEPTGQMTDSPAGESAATDRTAGTESPAARTESQPEPTHIHYVVAAVFSSEENADRYVAQNQGTVEGAVFEKVFYAPGRWVVSAYSSTEREQAEAHARALRKWSEGVWIYSKKIR